MNNINKLRKLVEDKTIDDDEFMSIIVTNLIECIEHDEEMTNRCNLLSALWQHYRDSNMPKHLYIDLVETVLKADRETIERLIKNNTVEKGE